MNGISGASSVNSTLATASTSSEQQVALAMLKKALDSQRNQGAELVQMLEGKGQIIDIRA